MRDKWMNYMKNIHIQTDDKTLTDFEEKGRR